jgi:hypothetical protein
METDLRLEKTLDSLIEEMVGEIGMDVATKCPVILGVYKTKGAAPGEQQCRDRDRARVQGVCPNGAAFTRCYEKIADKARMNAVLKRAPGGRLKKA